MRVRSFRSEARKEGRNKNDSGIKYDGRWRWRRRVFPLNEFRPVYFAYSIPPTKTHLSVFSRPVGRCGGRDIFWLWNISRLLEAVYVSRCVRLFVSSRDSSEDPSDSITNESVVICLMWYFICARVSLPLFRIRKRFLSIHIYVILLKYNMLL